MTYLRKCPLKLEYATGIRWLAISPSGTSTIVLEEPSILITNHVVDSKNRPIPKLSYCHRQPSYHGTNGNPMRTRYKLTSFPPAGSSVKLRMLKIARPTCSVRSGLHRVGRRESHCVLHEGVSRPLNYQSTTIPKPTDHVLSCTAQPRHRKDSYLRRSAGSDHFHLHLHV